MGKSRVFIFGKRREDAPKDEPQMTKEQMEECIKETEKYTKGNNDALTKLEE